MNNEKKKLCFVAFNDDEDYSGVYNLTESQIRLLEFLHTKLDYDINVQVTDDNPPVDI